MIQERETRQGQYWIRFQGRKWLLTGDPEGDGAITTAYLYENGLASYAHLYPDGRIMRFGKEIGKRKDIEPIGPADVKVENVPAAIVNMLTHPSWEGAE